MPHTPTATPWLDDPRWRDGSARSSALAELFPWWFGAVCCAGILTPVALAGQERVAEAGMLAFGVLGLVALCGVWLFAQAVRHTLAWRRFGRVHVVLDPFPGSIGGQMGGSIDVALDALAPEAARIVLSCIEVTIRRRRNKSSRHEAVVWTRECHPQIEPGPRGVRLRFTFDLPADLPETGEPSDHYHCWSLRVSAETAGLDLDRAIEVPVHRTPEPLFAAQPAQRGSVGTGSDRGHTAGGPALVGRGIRVGRDGEGCSLSYGRGRSRHAGAMAVVFGLVFAGIGIGLIAVMTGTHAVQTVFGWAMGSVFGGVGVAITLLGLWLLGNSFDVRLTSSTVATVRRYLGVPIARRAATVADIDHIETTITAQTGQGAKADVSYRMEAVLRDGGRLRLGDGIAGTSAAERLGRVVADVTGHEPRIVLRRSRRERHTRPVAAAS